MKALVLNSCLYSYVLKHLPYQLILALCTQQMLKLVLNSKRKKIKYIPTFWIQRGKRSNIFPVDTRLLFFFSSSLCQSDKHILFCHLELCFFKLEDNCFTALCWLKIWNTSGICLSTLGRGRANLLCIVPIFSICAAEASTRIVLFLMF